MVIAEIGAGLKSLKAALDLVKGLNAVATKAAINDVRIELQSYILAAQEALGTARDADSASAQRIRDLEQDIVRLKDWEAEKQRYQLEEVVVGAFARSPKPGMENGEPRHRLCANCFQKGEKSYLTRTPLGTHQVSLVCRGCKSGLMISGAGVRYLQGPDGQNLYP